MLFYLLMQNGPTETNAALEFAVNSLEVSDFCRQIFCQVALFFVNQGRKNVCSYYWLLMVCTLTGTAADMLGIQKSERIGHLVSFKTKKEIK